MIMEAEKPHDLPSVSWRPRITSDKIQSESEGLRTRWANDRYESPRAEDEIRCLSSVDEAGKKGTYSCFLLPLFCSGPEWIGWCPLILGRVIYSIPEKAMATHSSILAWKIAWTEETAGLQSMGSWRVGHDWATSLSPFTFMHWRRKWQPTPVFLPWESQGRGSLVGCRLCGPTESDTTEVT